MHPCELTIDRLRMMLISQLKSSLEGIYSQNLQNLECRIVVPCRLFNAVPIIYTCKRIRTTISRFFKRRIIFYDSKRVQNNLKLVSCAAVPS